MNFDMNIIKHYILYKITNKKQGKHKIIPTSRRWFIVPNDRTNPLCLLIKATSNHTHVMQTVLFSFTGVSPHF